MIDMKLNHLKFFEAFLFFLVSKTLRIQKQVILTDRDTGL